MPLSQAASSQSVGPTNLRCDSLATPLGIDSANPLFSWQLRDTRPGAFQTAYQVTVSSKPASSTADLWDSGRIESNLSTGIAYAGKPLAPSTRYYWHIRTWDAAGKPYAAIGTSWWETGLMSPDNWRAQWIGYEDTELHTLRESGAAWITNATSAPTAPGETHHDFRLALTLDKPIQRAALYTTGKDTVAAWVNSQQIIAPLPLPPWRQSPWGTYTRADVSASLHPGKNLVTIEVTTYLLPGQTSTTAQAPMSLCLYVVFTDGTTRLLTSTTPGWKAQLNAAVNWQRAGFDDASWQPALPYKPAAGGFGGDDAGLPWPTGPVAALRKTFTAHRNLVSARLYATALGAYELHLNGAKVGDQILAPGWMDYREHVPYQVYDVTKLVHRGGNALAAYLAPGWYSTPLMWFRQGNNYGATQPALKAQLRLEHADGTVEWIATDASWKAEDSPILQAEIYDGQTVDARKAEDGWDRPAFPDAAWKPAMLVHPEEPEVLAQYFQPIRLHQALTAKAITSPAPGVYIFDFGQNMSAQPHLEVRGTRGQDVQLRFGEVLNPDGTLYVENLRTAKATDHFILAGSATPEDFQPQFTFHGFRYAEITGLKTPPTPATLKAIVLHTDAPFTARFSTADPVVNQIWSNVVWGQRSNFVGVPTDCPQRDERLGWSADAQVFWRTATFNMDLATFSQKYAADLHGTQSGTAMYGIFAPGVPTSAAGAAAAWSDAGVIVPWTGWIQTGDRRIVDQSWTGMEAYLGEILHQNPDHLWRKGFGIPFGDWLTPTLTTPEDLLATAYWAYDVTLMKQMAAATGREEDAARCAALFTEIKTAFEQAFVHPDGSVSTIDHYPSIPPPTLHPTDDTTSKDRPVETQTGYVLALHMDLIPANLRAAAAQRLATLIEQNHSLLGTGFLGTPYLLEVLSDTGHSDLAYKLLLNRDYPSWGYLVAHGATTTWERWNGDQMRGDPSMNSYNHYAYGAVAEWMYRYAAGIDTQPENPGFRTIELHPNFDARLGHLSFDYDSTYGPIHSSWVVSGSNVTWKVTIPPNTTAILRTAATNALGYRLHGIALDQATAIHPARAAGDYILPPGSYIFTAALRESQTAAAADPRLH